MFSSTQINLHGLDGYGFETVYLARQPIVNRDEELWAYELLFRSGAPTYDATFEATEATASVVRNAFYGMGIESTLGSVRGFVNVDEHFLMSEAVESLPAQHIVLEILETVQESPRVIERVRSLKQLGYVFALDDYTGEQARYAGFLTEVAIVKVDILGMPQEQVRSVVSGIRRPGLTLLAEKVESREEFAYCRELGFDLFQGYFFAKPQTLRSKQITLPQQADLLKLVKMTTDDNTEFAQIADLMKRLPAVTLGVLRATNSASSGLRRQVSSLKEALMVVGRANLRRIVLMMVYSKPGANPKANPLMLLAASRGRLLESLAGRHPETSIEEQDCAYLVGMLSLIEPIMNVNLETVCKELGLSATLEAALVSRAGILGNLLALCENAEKGVDEEVMRALTALPGLSGSEFVRLQMNATAWADSAVG
ncbi:MAG: EAL domain-containing protein [Burkholderiaceae bacterium]|jgi:EAL and modified HD-GYP domain-containing signal transduction protein